jgi:hypothetical protein
MKMLLVGAVGVLALQALLLTGTYIMRITPEVVNCDRGRQSVHLEVTKTLRAYQTHIVRREIGECNLWFHAR